MAANSLEPLVPTLQTIAALHEQLVYVKWRRESFVALERAAQQLLEQTRNQSEYAWIAGLTERLLEPLRETLSGGRLPEGLAREQLLSLLDDLYKLLLQAHVKGEDDWPVRRAAAPTLSGEILLLAGPAANNLTVELEGCGFEARRVNTFAELRGLMAGDAPLAVLVDMDAVEGEMLISFNMVAAQEERLGRKAPLFFLSEHTDLAARLEAISAGGKGYFTKPVNVQLLMDALYDRLQADSMQGRVLIVSDNPGEAQRLAEMLNHPAIFTRQLEQPLEVVRELRRWQPELLLLDLDMRALYGVELALAIRQHEAYNDLPMLLLSGQTHLDPALAAFGAGGDDVLRKPVSGDYLLAAVTGRLHRAQSLSYKINHLGRRDTVTGLYSRRYFLDQLEKLSSAPRAAAVMLITCDNLRELEARDVNLADAVLEQAAARLRAVLEPNQQAARFSDAMFAVLLSGAERAALLDTARAVRASLETEVYRVGEEDVRLHTSVGVSVARAEEQDGSRLIQQADMACAIARDSGRESWRERIHIYNPQTDWEATASQRQRLLEEIQEALEQRRLGLVFQPIVSLRGDTAARYEALLRMRNQEGQELLPETVFGVAQNHRLGLLLERWVIGNAIRLLREQQAQNESTILFVNISPAALQDEAIIEWIQAALARAGVQPDKLVFEIAEAKAQKYLPDLCRFVEAMRGLGCSFSLDRFHGGEAARLLLERLPVDYIKLDPHFFHELGADQAKQQELRQLVQSLEAQQIVTVASSIENMPTLQTLRACGLNFAQGFYLQPPDKEMGYNFAGAVG